MSAVQLKLGFDPAPEPFHAKLSLAGLMVYVQPVGVRDEVAVSVLSTHGIPAVLRPEGVVFPVAYLRRLPDVTPDVSFASTDELEALTDLCLNPPSSPAEVSSPISGKVVLSWFDGFHSRTHDLTPASALALLAMDIPFVATAEAFEHLRTSYNLPLLVGRARVNPDGFIEIATPKPQLAEAAPIPGMFRLNPTTLGVPLAYKDAVTAAPGFLWATPPPKEALPQLRLPSVFLSDQLRAELDKVAYSLSASRALVVAWPPGGGRRMFALAGVYSLSALPCLVVAPPSKVWLWRRHASMLGLSVSSTPFSQVCVVSYDSLPALAQKERFASVIFDSLQNEVSSPAAGYAKALTASSHVMALDVETSWPEDPALQNKVLAVLRPHEFDADLPLGFRYPSPSNQRFAEHAACYLSSTPSSPAGFLRRSSVRAAPAPDGLAKAMREVQSATLPPPIKLATLLDMTSSGTPGMLSPKVTWCLEIMRASSPKEATVFVTRSHRTARMLCALSSGPMPEYKSGPAPAGFSYAIADRDLPSLVSFSNVVFVDIPWSLSALDEAVGPPDSGPSSVTVLHLEGSVDDRLALLAARRADGAPGSEGNYPPREQEARWLIAY